MPEGWLKKNKSVWTSVLKSQQRKPQHLNAYFWINTSARGFSSKGYMPEMQKDRILFSSGKSPMLQHSARSTRTETIAWASVGACFISHNMVMWAFVYCACPCCLILCKRIYSHMWAGDAGGQRCAAVQWDCPPAKEKAPSGKHADPMPAAWSPYTSSVFSPRSYPCWHFNRTALCWRAALSNKNLSKNI